jgi:phosphatidylglycerol lysyltransferase
MGNSERRSTVVTALALATFGSGAINLWSLAMPDVPHRVALLRTIFPLEFLQLSRVLTFLIGIALVVAAIHVYRRKARALHIVGALSVLSIAFHLTKGIDYEAALCSVVLLALLVAGRQEFQVRSARPDWRGMAVVSGGVLAVLMAYGLVRGAVNATAAELRVAASAQLTVAASVLYGTLTAFRPATYRLRTAPQQRARASRLIGVYGRSDLDSFKVWPEKSVFFGPSGETFLAYGVALGMAVVLGDPVGRDDEIQGIVRAFSAECYRNDWSLAFYQTQPDFLPIYRKLGFRRLKIGDEALVDLAEFSLDGPARKSLRTGMRKIEAAGIGYEHYDPPIAASLIDEMQAVSDEWLRLPGRRERHFALGHFDRRYVQNTPVAVARAADGGMSAFANILLSGAPTDSVPPFGGTRRAVADLMRRRAAAPNGVMDYLFLRTFMLYRERGIERFSLGMAPMAGFTASETASPEERAVHAFFQQLDFMFSFRGIKSYKSKFATAWEPRYVIFRHLLDLPRIGFALKRLSDAPRQEA